MNKQLKSIDGLKVYHVQGWTEYSNWFPNRILVDTIEEADVVVFEGGEDVDPSLYGENRHHTTYSNIKRDEYEKFVFAKALKLGKHIWGTCRGSQFLCVMAGGKLVQNQNNPAYIHKIDTYDGKELYVTSTHHQAQYPYNLPEDSYKILGWTNMLPFHKDGNDKELNPIKECEIVYYPNIKAIGCQSHPEMEYPAKNNDMHDMIEYMRGLLGKLINDEVFENQIINENLTV